MKKHVLSIILVLFTSKSVVAENSVDQLIRYSSELTTLKANLEIAKRSKTHSQIKLWISEATALALLVSAHGLANKRVLDLFAAETNLVLATVLRGATVIPISYGAYHGFQIYFRSSEIDGLLLAISQKQEELEAAKKLLNAVKN